MTRGEIRQVLKGHANGGDFITQKQLADCMGVSRDTARRKLHELDAIDGKYYFIPEVADALLKRRIK